MSQLPNFKRDITQELQRRLAQKTLFIQVVRGPRQVGKTTAVKQVLEALNFPSHYATADLPAPPDPSWLEDQWEQARLLEKQGKPTLLVLDEVQKINQWSEQVKRLWDEDKFKGRDLRVVLLGSSSLLLQKGLTESLAGRFEILRFPHWGFKECQECFGWDLDQYLYFGGYPGGAPLIQEELRWADYIRESLIETTLSRDLLLLYPVEKPVVLRKLFVLACEYGGQILSYQKILGQLQDVGNTTTLTHYARLLQSAYLIATLEKYSGSKVRRRGSIPKWLPLNTALMTALLKRNFSEIRKDRATWGRLIECSVGAYLFQQAQQHGLELYYWREGGEEVDFVLQKGKAIVALEVKSGRPKPITTGVTQFKKKYQPQRTIFIGEQGMGIEKFLTSNVLELFD